jgi:hypothetical protein
MFKGKIVNIISGKCKNNADEIRIAHKYMEEELAKDYAKHHDCSAVSIFDENGEFKRNVVVK